jgi:hypothetical protein
MIPELDGNVKEFWDFSELTQFGATGDPPQGNPDKGRCDAGRAGRLSRQLHERAPCVRLGSQSTRATLNGRLA